MMVTACQEKNRLCSSFLNRQKVQCSSNSAVQHFMTDITGQHVFHDRAWCDLRRIDLRNLIVDYLAYSPANETKEQSIPCRRINPPVRRFIMPAMTVSRKTIIHSNRKYLPGIRMLLSDGLSWRHPTRFFMAVILTQSFGSELPKNCGQF